VTEGSIWSVLGVAATRDVGEIRRAYAAKLKVTNPEDDAEGFRRLREAYETALDLARGRILAPVFAEADGDDDWPINGDEAEAGDNLDGDADRGQPPPFEPAAEAEGLEPRSSVDYDNLWRRLDALVFGSDEPEPKALAAALEAILFHPELEALGAYVAAEQRVAALIARGAPRTDPLIAPARARFDWLALAEQRTASPEVLQAMWRERQAGQEAAIAALEALLRQPEPPPEHQLDRALNAVTRGVLEDEAVWRFTESELCRLILEHAPRLDAYIGAIGGSLGWNRRYADERVPQISARFEAIQARRRLASAGHPLHRAWTLVQKPPSKVEPLLQVIEPRRYGRIRQLLAALRKDQPALLKEIAPKAVRAWDDYFRIALVNPFLVALLAAFALVVTTCSIRQGAQEAARATRYYPPAALRAGLPGEVMLRCRARYDGQLGSCDVVSEAPVGRGFREAAQKIANDGLLRTYSDAPHDWERFDADVRFIPPGPGRQASIHFTVQENTEAEHAASPSATDPGFVQVSGAVRLRCLRAANGALSQCQALSETPAGVGLGDLAVNYAQDGVLKAPPGPPGWVEFTAPVSEEVASNAREQDLRAPRPPRVNGRVILSCLVQPSGRMRQCQVLWQSPRGQGLGEHAMAEAEQGRITLRRPVTTARRVNIDIPYGPHPPPTPPVAAWAPDRDLQSHADPLQLEPDQGSAGAIGPGKVDPIPLDPKPQPNPTFAPPPAGPTASSTPN